MKAILDYDGKVNKISESLDESGAKSLFIEGIFAQAEKKNRNKRIYPKNVLEKAVDRYLNEYVSCNRAMGELNHPSNPFVNPERACILIKDLHWDGNDVYGKAKILNTDTGKCVASLINDGVQLGVSTRGIGSISEKLGENVVESDYVINAIDVVSNPSGIDCWVNGILENVEFYYNNGVLVESTIDEYLKHKRLGNISQLKEDFNDFVKNLTI